MQLLFKSLSPNSILIGIPFTSDEANLNPGDLSLSSIYAVISFDNNLFSSSFAISITLVDVPIGTITAFVGAILGGKTNP